MFDIAFVSDSVLEPVPQVVRRKAAARQLAPGFVMPFINVCVGASERPLWRLLFFLPEFAEPVLVLHRSR